MQTFALKKNDRLLLYTDGIIEAAGRNGELFGLERLKQLLASCAAVDYLEMLEHLFATLRKFGAPDPPQDDCTAIVIDFHGPLF